MREITLTLTGGATTITTLSDTATAEETRATIQAALNEASANATGGTVHLSAGFYVVTAGIDAGEGALRVGSNTTFEGTGTGQTTIQLAANPGHDVTGVVRTDSGKTNPDGSVIATHDIVIRNLSIDANKDETGTALVDGFFCGPKPFTALSADNNVTLQNVEVFDASRYGFDPHEQTTNLSFIDCIARDNAQDGFTIDYCSAVTITNCEAYGNGRHGFNIVTSSHDIVMTGNLSHDNGASGIVVQTGNFETRIITTGITITGGSVTNNAGDGIVIRQANDVTIGGVNAADGVTISGNGRFGVLIEGGDGITIENNAILNNAGGTGSDDAEIRIRGYAQTYLDSDPLNDVFEPSAGITIASNTIGGVGISHNYSVSYSDTTNLVLASSNTLQRTMADTVEDTSKQGETPLFVAQITTGDDNITGTNGADSITADSGNDSVSGGLGNDTLYGADGNDTLNGGTGSDTLTGGFGDDVFVADSSDTIVELEFGGTDEVRTAELVFTLAALSHVENLAFIGNGNFSGTGNAGVNIITGGNGNDILDGAGGADQLEGGAGNDTYFVDQLTDDLIDVSGIDTIKSILSWTLADEFENLTLLGPSALNATGNGASNIIIGNDAVNILTGLDGNDTLNGGLGGGDTLDGGLGNDTYVIDTATDIILDAGGIDTIRAALSFTLASNFEKIVLTGTGAFGGTGNSLANTITGNIAANKLKGLGGNDFISGGGGRDTIEGGTGNDRLTGGADADSFVFNTKLSTSSNVDRVTDFSVPLDTFRLENAVFTKIAGTGKLTAAQLYQGAAAHDADDRIVYNSATGALFYDSDGNGAAAAVRFATLNKGLALTNADFMII